MLLQYHERNTLKIINYHCIVIQIYLPSASSTLIEESWCTRRKTKESRFASVDICADCRVCIVLGMCEVPKSFKWPSINSIYLKNIKVKIKRCYMLPIKITSLGKHMKSIMFQLTPSKISALQESSSKMFVDSSCFLFLVCSNNTLEFSPILISNNSKLGTWFCQPTKLETIWITV